MNLLRDIVALHCTARCTFNPIYNCGIGRKSDFDIFTWRWKKKCSRIQFVFFPVGFCDRLLNVRMWMYVARHLYCFYDVMEQQHQFQKIHSKSRMIKIFKENFFERPTGDFFSGFSIVLCQFLRRLYLLAVNKSSLTFRRCFKYTQKIWPSLFIPHKLRSNV